ncbi:AMP-binding protein [Sulfitobacter sp. G21635-S1]|uniref:AMP-binding protein n=1 Tax=Sulfitobacter sp. G21635-S1 TaxID=3014043 RepID=UPI0022AE6CF0|nr:AMP-binding protein [Sulfitobacter sp. G21635-S1]MCZ4258128.1 AMP-binding protein [Sulfitobacter sp. G21635-S1]
MTQVPDALHRPAPATCGLLPAVVLSHADTRPRQIAFHYINPAAPSQELTYGALAQNARALAGGLLAAGCENGARVALICGHGPAFITGLVAILMAGCAAVPVVFPAGAIMRSRAAAILREAGCAAILTGASRAEIEAAGADDLFAGHPLLRIDELASPGGTQSNPALPLVRPEDVAIVQYTSGSTSAPRGVLVTHAALAAQQRAISAAVQPRAQERSVTWLPPEHDMGLMGGLLFNLWRGHTTCVLAPAAFINRPIRWLEAISRFKATLSVAPNFAYDLCVRTIPQNRRAGLDLRSWRVALNGAEPVQATTLDSFAQAFADSGFDRRAFLPCYGLAEATLLVAGASGGNGATTGWFDPEAMAQGIVARAGAGQGRQLVSSGPVRTTGGIRIVSADTGHPCPPERIGEIWIAGDSMGSGYLGQPEASRDTFCAYTATGDGPYLRSGDTGFLLDGELFVTGRIKDIVLWHGRTLHAADLERALEGVEPRVRQRRLVLRQTGAGEIVLIAEVPPNREDAPMTTAGRDDQALASRLWRRLLAKTGVEVDQVALVRPGTLRWTSSGKIRRAASLARLQDEPDRVICDWRPDHGKSRQAQLAALRALADSARNGPPDAAALLAFFLAWVAAATDVPLDEVDPDLPWSDQGLDSLMMTDLSLDLESVLGAQIRTEDLFDQPDPRMLALTLARRMVAAQP